MDAETRYVAVHGNRSHSQGEDTLAPALALALILLQPQRMYYQPEQPVIVTLDTSALREATDTAGAFELVLLSSDGKREASAKLTEPASTIDLAEHFAGQPGLWDGRTHYVQAVAAGRAVGTPLVVVPLMQPNRPPNAKPDGLRVQVARDVLLHTDQGDITIRLTPEVAPNTTLRFSQLVEGGFYTGVIFHRIVPGFVIQGGDPTGSGRGGPGYQIDLEPSTMPHERGTISMARQGHDVNTGGSQFFICLTREKCAPLDGQYTAFGQVTSGLGVVDRIASSRLQDPRSGRPKTPSVILTAEMVPMSPMEVGKGAEAGRQ